MKIKIILFVAFLMVSTLPAASLECGSGVYTYYDMWFDEDGKAVALNFADGESPCGNFLVYSDITVTLPGPTSYFSYAYQSCCAESIAEAIMAEGDEGTLEGSSQVDYECGDTASDSFTALIAIAHTNYVFTGMESTACRYDLYCPNGNQNLSCLPAVTPLYAFTYPCLNYLHDLRLKLTIGGTVSCFPVGKAQMSSSPRNCS